MVGFFSILQKIIITAGLIFMWWNIFCAMLIGFKQYGRSSSEKIWAHTIVWWSAILSICLIFGLWTE